MRRTCALLAVIAGIGLLSDEAAAQGGGPGNIHLTVGPGDGTRLHTNSIFYDQATHRIDVTVHTGVPAPPAGQVKDWLFVIAGQPVAPQLVLGNFGAQTTVPVGPRPLFSQIGFTVELVYKRSKRVVARETSTIWDLRDNPLEPTFGDQQIHAEIGVQITGRGLDALEPIHAASMPFPDAQAFDERLDNLPRISGVPLTLDNHFRNGADQACVRVDQQPRAFTGTGGYLSAFAQATALFALHEGTQAVGAGAEVATDVIAAALGVLAGGPLGVIISEAVTDLGEVLALALIDGLNCVKDLPRPEHFEVCVGTMKGPITDVDIDRVSAVDLSLSNGSIRADVTLSGVHAEVEGKLRNLIVRWAEHGGICTMVPEEPITDDTVDADATLSDWATCRGLRVSATTASTLDIDPNLNVASSPLFQFGSGLETVQVNQVGDAAFELSAGGGMTANVAACGEPAILPATQRFLSGYYGKVDDAVNLAWNEGSPATQHAEALAALFSPLSIGTRATPDLELNSPIREVSIREGIGDPYPPHGVIASWDTDPLELFVNRRPRSWVYPLKSWTYPGGDPPGVDRFFDNVPLDLGMPREPFDLSLMLTPGTLNQYLRERYRSPQYGLMGPFRPTYDDLGVRPPKGVDGSTPLTLTGKALGRNIHRAFNTFGNTRFRIDLRPKSMPFINIPDIMFPVGSGDMPIVYQLTGLEVDFVSEAPNDPNPVKLRLVGGFGDTDLEFVLDTATGTLQPVFSTGATTGFMVLRSQLSNCDLTPRVFPAKGTCEDDLAAGVTAFLGPHVDSRMRSMLNDFAVPALFDVNGKVSPPLEAQTTMTWVDAGLIQFFAKLAPPK